MNTTPFSPPSSPSQRLIQEPPARNKFLTAAFLLLLTLITIPAARAAEVVAAATGNWSSTTTWVGGVLPGVEDDVKIPTGITVTLNADVECGGILVEGKLTVERANRTLLCDYVFVQTAGAVFEVGTSASRFLQNFTLTLKGLSTEPAPMMGAKVLGAHNGGTLEIHGRDRIEWTHLGVNAAAGATSLTLVEPVDWVVGDSILVTSSRSNWNEAETRTITAVSTDQRTVSFSTPLAYLHSGSTLTRTRGTDGKTWTANLRAEVGLLSRNVKIQGDADSETAGFGGHIMVMDGGPTCCLSPGKAYIQGVELFRMGQKSIVGRYPMHWHMVAEGGVGQYFRDNVVRRSFNRAITIHGTESTTVENNFCYDHLGHGIFLENGSERFNVIRKNVVALSKKPAVGEEILETDNAFDGFQNSSPSSYWITNPNNIFTDNVAAGTEGTGFWFAFPRQPLNESLTHPSFAGLEPHKEPLGAFDRNTAHSCKLAFDINDQLSSTDKLIMNGEWANNGPFYLNDCTWYSNETAVYAGIGGERSNVIYYNNIFADNIFSLFLATYHLCEESLMIADSGLNLRPAETIRTLYVVYDGPGRMKNNHLVGYDAPNANFLQNAGAAKKRVNHYFEGLTFDPPKPVRSVMPNLDFIPPANIDANGQAHPRVWGMVIVDVDGSISGVPNSSIISNHPFMLTGGETRPSEWTNTYRSDNRFAQCRLEYGVPHGSFPDVSVVRTKPGTPTRGVYYINGYNEWHQLPLIVRKDFLYTYSYPILPSTKKVIVNFEDAEAGAHSVLRFKDFGKLGSLTVSGMTSYSSLANLKAGSTSGFYREPNGDLYLRPVATAARHSYTIAWSSNGAYTPLILDSDGDGTSDGDEAAAGTDPFRTVNGTDPFVDTEFNVAGNFENWDSFSGIINEAVASNGTMSGRSSSTDPQMFSRNLRIDGNAVPALLVRFKASANGAAQFSWKKLNDTDFTTARSVSVHYHGNDQWQTLVFPMGSNAEWQNQVITDLRFDPVAAENVDFQMDYIRGSTTVPISISTVPDQTIPINSSTGQVAVTVGYGTNDPSPLQLSATSSNPTLVPSSGIVFAGSAANRAIAVTPAAYQFGSSLITISVSDGQLTTSSTFTVTVTQPVPTDRTWSGAGGNNNWSTGANWGGTAPLPSDPLFFAGTTRLTPNNDLPADLSFAGIQFNSAAGAFTLSGNRITLGGNITFSGNPASAVTQTINLDMLLSDNRTITTRSTGPITIGGIIDDGASGFGLNKTGLGTLTLTGPNTFDGQVTIGNGTLAVSRIANVGTASSLGDATGADSIIRLGTSNNEGILSYIGTTAASTDRQVQINTGPATIGNSAVDSNHALVFTHPTFNAQSATATAYTLTLNGTNTGNNEVQGIMQDNTTTAVSLTKASTGKWIVSGVNTFSGRVFVDSGILSINTLANVGTASSLGTGSTTPTIQFGTGTRTGTLEYTGIGGTAGETNRQIQIGSTTANHAGGGVILNNGTTGALTFSNPAFNAPVAGVTATRTLTLGGGNTDANTISGVITNNGSGKINLVKTDAGTWVLGGTNTYTGTTTVTGGTLALGANNVLPNSSAMTIGTATLDAATFGDTLGTLDTTGSAVINLGSGAALAFADSKAIDWTGGTLSITGTFVSGSSLRFGTSSAGLTAAQLAKISKPGGGPVALNASGYLINGPFLSVTGTPLAAVNTTYGTPSPSSTNFTLAGIGLSPASGNVLVAALSGYEYALIEGGPYTATLSLPYSGGTLPSTQVFVRLTATATVAGSPYAGNIVVSGGGAASLSIATVPSAVSKATPTVTVTPGTYTYNGSAQGPTAYTTSPAGHTGTPTWSYVGTGATNYPANATQPTAAGTYTATVSLATDNNFETASSPATAFTIANGDPYLAWSEGAPFDADANNDGVKNGLAWLLGAADPNASATRLLPTALHEDGDLVLTFRMRNEAGRGGAVLQLQHCNDLGGSTGWCTSVTIPEQSDTQAGVTFTITPNGDMNDVEASIPSTESAAGRLFGRLNGVSAP